jgi:hypothetical protein
MTQPTDIRRALALLAPARPFRVLDRCCCIGGGTEGYRRAFGLHCHITGVDIEPQPDYRGDDFHQGDVIDFIRAHGHEFDFIHISPPCQGEGASAKVTNAARNAAIGRAYLATLTPAPEVAA